MTGRMKAMLLVGVFTASTSVNAQAATGGETAEPGAAKITADRLFTQAELENLVAPVALFPDTLLIQILVASTQPIEVVKADRLLLANA
ncbi:MAG: DUF3300 domain-containing protein, partial [Pseudomonadota bacterium]